MRWSKHSWKMWFCLGQKGNCIKLFPNMGLSGKFTHFCPLPTEGMSVKWMALHWLKYFRRGQIQFVRHLFGRFQFWSKRHISRNIHKNLGAYLVFVFMFTRLSCLLKLQVHYGPGARFTLFRLCGGSSRVNRLSLALACMPSSNMSLQSFSQSSTQPEVPSEA